MAGLRNWEKKGFLGYGGYWEIWRAVIELDFFSFKELSWDQCVEFIQLQNLVQDKTVSLLKWQCKTQPCEAVTSSSMMLKQSLDHCGQECGNKISGPQGRLHHLTFKKPFDFEVYGFGRVDRKGSVLRDLHRTNALSETDPLDVAPGVRDPLDTTPGAARADARLSILQGTHGLPRLGFQTLLQGHSSTVIK